MFTDVPNQVNTRCPGSKAPARAGAPVLFSSSAGPVPFPERLAADRWIAAALCLLSCAYLLLFLRFTAMDPDEGITLQGAQRIVEGQLLYRDFFAFITP